MKKMQEAELRVVKFELSDVIVASGYGGQSNLCSNYAGCGSHEVTGQYCDIFTGCTAWSSICTGHNCPSYY